MFPYVAEIAKSKQSTTKLLFKSLLYVGGLAVVTATVLNTFSSYAIGLLFGYEYVRSVEYIFAVSLWMIPLSLLTLLSNYVLAINKTKIFSWSLLAGSALCFVLITMLCADIIQIIQILAIVSFVLLITNLIGILMTGKKKSDDLLIYE